MAELIPGYFAMASSIGTTDYNPNVLLDANCLERAIAIRPQSDHTIEATVDLFPRGIAIANRVSIQEVWVGPQAAQEYGTGQAIAPA